MWAERAPPCRTLGQYVAELVRRLEEGEPHALARLREIVGDRAAHIALDAETVRVRFVDGRLRVRSAGPRDRVHGAGGTDRATTLDLLDGYTDPASALLAGRLEACGEIDALARIFQAVEVLLDGASRIPALQAMERDYRRDPCRPAAATLLPRRASFLALAPDAPDADEGALLARLDLLPDDLP